MPAFPRAELDEMVQRWLDANRDCERNGDWRPLAEMYTPDATYGWNMGPNEEFMAAGRDQIRDIALALEMGGLDGWSYPYQKVLVDDAQGEVVGAGHRPDRPSYGLAAKNERKAFSHKNGRTRSRARPPVRLTTGGRGRRNSGGIRAGHYGSGPTEPLQCVLPNSIHI